MGLFKRRRAAEPVVEELLPEDGVEHFAVLPPLRQRIMPTSHPVFDDMLVDEVPIRTIPTDTPQWPITPGNSASVPATPSTSITTTTTTSTSVQLAPRVERALLTLAAHAQQIEDRLARLEQRVDTGLHDLATQADVLDVRLHSARLAAEVARVGVELARVDEATKVQTTVSRDQRLRDLAELLAELVVQDQDAETGTVDEPEEAGDGSSWSDGEAHGGLHAIA